MSTVHTDSTPATLLEEALEQARLQASEQLAAAWQLYVSRIEQQLHSGWEKHLQQLLDERFGKLAASLTAEAEAAFEARIQSAVESARSSERALATRLLAEHLNQAARRLRQSETQQDWSTALLDGVSTFSERAAVFTIQGSSLRLEKASFESGTLEVALDAAPAFASASETQDPVICAFAASELSAQIADRFGKASADRVHLLPLVSLGKTVAILYAETFQDHNAMELISSIAASVWELRASTRTVNPPSLVSIQGFSPPTPHASSWAELSPEEQELHLRAQRYARVQVAEIRLYQSQAVKEGRTAHSLYPMLKNELDKAREAYRQQFLNGGSSMVDYLHVEIVRTLANDDATLLGPEYPGPLV